MIGFERLAGILGALDKNGHNLDATKKEELRVFLKGVLEGKEEETSENIVSAFREKLKTEAKDELKADEAIKTEAKDELKADQAIITAAKDELKTDQATITAAKAELKADQATITAAKAELKTEKLKTEAQNELSSEMQEKVNKLEQIEKEKTDLQTQLGAANTQKTELEKQLSKKGEELEAEKLKAEQEKTELQAKFDQEKQALEAKNKTTEQPKQGNGARYTATVGMGLAAGLIAFTALERTVRLEMLVMIGIAVASALVAGSITYVALPSTQVDGAKAQEVNENGKKK
ncbi:hypothetical protein [Wolbachia endosymbiont (group A) of Andrena dorsata]|uniref:hypothetical protein n=1 Tax=Wolbachia endosymbiont (group A) of Andrena dorsata TaxID=2953975 RepID=UPI0022322E91|nr:hypothetical protein [Wolbachia endosymbiont (group A) of Andrena dorsata]